MQVCLGAEICEVSSILWVNPYQSPLPSPLARELLVSLLTFPAAAEAKLVANGDGIVADTELISREEGEVKGIRISVFALVSFRGLGKDGQVPREVSRSVDAGVRGAR